MLYIFIANKQSDDSYVVKKHSLQSLVYNNKRKASYITSPKWSRVNDVCFY